MTDAPVRTRPFADFLRETNRGTTHDELSEYLQQLTAAVSDTGKKGSLSLRIDVEPIKGDNAAFSISDKITLKLPEHDRGSSMFFRDADNNLTRRDPRQLEFESLREAPAPPGVDPATGEVKDVVQAVQS